MSRAVCVNASLLTARQYIKLVMVGTTGIREEVQLADEAGGEDYIYASGLSWAAG